MPKEIRLPQLGQTMEEGTVVNIRVKAGDKINKGDVIFEVETDKATQELESPAAGVVKAILVEQGQTIPVNAPMLVIGEEREEVRQDFIDSLTGNAPEASKPQPSAAEKKPSADIASPAEAMVVRLPQLGQTMEEGTVVTILVKVGDKINEGGSIFEIETDKATQELESPAAGVVKAILVEQGQTIPVNAPMLVIGNEHEEVGQDFINSLTGIVTSKARPEQPQAKSEQNQQVKLPQQPVSVTSGRIFASPRAKMVAKELGISISDVTAASNNVRITEADVRNVAASGSKPLRPSAQKPLVDMPSGKNKLGERVLLTKTQKIVGQKMLLSKQNIPCFYFNTIVDMTEAVNFRMKFNKTAAIKISFNDIIIRAVGLAISKNWPLLTGQIDGNYIQLKDSVGIGLAIAVEDGLVAPIIKAVESKSLEDIAKAARDLIDKAKANRLNPDDLTGGCTTISNLGGFGIDSFIPIVVPGQATIFGIGKITDTCVPVDGNILVRKLMAVTLSLNHIVLNGAEGAQFLACVKKYLESPESLI